MPPESLFMTKPGPRERVVRQDAVGTAMSLGLAVRLLGEKILTPDEAHLIYHTYEGEEWFPAFLDYLTSGQVAVYLTEGERAVERTIEVRNAVRARHAEDRRKNAIHAPKNEEAFRENLEQFRQIFANI